jgi:hypothetical protein
LARSVPYSDRAFRALVRDQPDVLIALLDATLRPALGLKGPITPQDVDEPHLDLPPGMDADSVARCGDVVLHTECQAYNDRNFDDRLFRYHLHLALRYRELRVETVALWLTAPAPDRRHREITRDNVTVRVHVVVLPEVPAQLLLTDPRTACFAVGADPSSLSAEDLCTRVAETLRDATKRELHMAAVAARLCGRYAEMIRAMQAAKIDPVIIEDLVEIGRDMGLEQGRAEGIERGRAEGIERGRAEGIERGHADGLEAVRQMLLDVIVMRGLELTDTERERISAERSLDRLREWHKKVLSAESLTGVLD